MLLVESSKELLEKQKIKHVGPDKGGHWEITN